MAGIAVAVAVNGLAGFVVAADELSGFDCAADFLIVLPIDCQAFLMPLID